MPGRKPFRATQEQRELVERCKAVGMRDQDVRQLVISPTTGRPISLNVFKREFAYELQVARTRMEHELVKTMQQRATDANDKQGVQAGMFLLRTRFGYYDSQSIVISPEEQAEAIRRSMGFVARETDPDADYL